MIPGDLHTGAALPPLHSPRPYWHPLRLGDRVLTDDAPDDHPWHHGLSVAVANMRVGVTSVNGWGGPTFVDGDYRQLDNNGSQVVLESSPDGQRIEWRDALGEPFLSELRGISVEPVGTGWRLEVRSDWSVTGDEAVAFGSPTTAGRGNAGYGGFFLRGAADLVGAAVELDGERMDGETARGRTGRRCALIADGIRLTMESAEPTPWFVRTEPVVMLCAAPFFHEELVLPPGASRSWMWSLEAS